MANQRTVLVRRPDRPGRVVLDAVGVAAVAGLAAAAMLDLFRDSPRVPSVYAGDGLSSAAWVRGIIETGWVNSNPRLGAPFGQVHYDYPLGADNLHFLIIRAMAMVTGDWALIVNLFFVVSFSTAACFAYLGQRWLGVGRLPAAVCALVFAFLPYHFARGPEHLLLSSYFVVPIGVVVACAVYSGIPPRSDWPTVRSVAMLRLVGLWAAAVLVVGSCGAYYALFTVLLVGVAAGLGAAAQRSLRPVWAGGLVTAGIGATLVGNLSGSIRYRRAHGVNDAVATRAPIELDGYPLRFADLITPLRETRWPGLDGLADKATLPLATATGQYQGIIGVACLTALGLWLVAGRRGRETEPVRALLAAGVIVFLAVGTAGGLAWLGNIVGFTQLRVLSRASIFISFLALTWGALSVGPWLGRVIRQDRRRLWAARSAAAALVLVAWFDQVPTQVTRDAGAAATFASDRDYFVGIETGLDPGSAIFVLPVRGYPEEPPTFASADYDLLRPYLSTRTLRFSYGGIKGREMEWQRALADAGPEQLVADLAATGFVGLLVDRFGYAGSAATLLEQVSAVTSATARIDATGRWAFFDLRPYRNGMVSDIGVDALRGRGAAVLQDPVVTYADCYGLEPYEGTTATWCPAQASVSLRTASETVRARVTASVYASSEATLTVAWGDSSLDLPIGPDRGAVTFDIDVPPAGTQVNLSTDAEQVAEPGSNRDLHMLVIGLDAEVIPQR